MVEYAPAPERISWDVQWPLDRTEAEHMAGRWVDVGEASRELGISTDALRKRVARRSLQAKGERSCMAGRGWDKTECVAQVDCEALVEDLREQVHQRASEGRGQRLAQRPGLWHAPVLA